VTHAQAGKSFLTEFIPAIFQKTTVGSLPGISADMHQAAATIDPRGFSAGLFAAIALLPEEVLRQEASRAVVQLMEEQPSRAEQKPTPVEQEAERWFTANIQQAIQQHPEGRNLTAEQVKEAVEILNLYQGVAEVNEEVKKAVQEELVVFGLNRQLAAALVSNLVGKASGMMVPQGLVGSQPAGPGGQRGPAGPLTDPVAFLNAADGISLFILGQGSRYTHVIVRAILEARAERPFDNWDDFDSRVRARLTVDSLQRPLRRFEERLRGAQLPVLDQRVKDRLLEMIQQANREQLQRWLEEAGIREGAWYNARRIAERVRSGSLSDLWELRWILSPEWKLFRFVQHLSGIAEDDLGIQPSGLTQPQPFTAIEVSQLLQRLSANRAPQKREGAQTRLLQHIEQLSAGQSREATKLLNAIRRSIEELVKHSAIWREKRDAVLSSSASSGSPERTRLREEREAAWRPLQDLEAQIRQQFIALRKQFKAAKTPPHAPPTAAEPATSLPSGIGGITWDHQEEMLKATAAQVPGAQILEGMRPAPVASLEGSDETSQRGLLPRGSADYAPAAGPAPVAQETTAPVAPFPPVPVSEAGEVGRRETERASGRVSSASVEHAAQFQTLPAAATPTQEVLPPRASPYPSRSLLPSVSGTDQDRREQQDGGRDRQRTAEQPGELNEEFTRQRPSDHDLQEVEKRFGDQGPPELREDRTTHSGSSLAQQAPGVKPVTPPAQEASPEVSAQAGISRRRMLQLAAVGLTLGARVFLRTHGESVSRWGERLSSAWESLARAHVQRLFEVQVGEWVYRTVVPAETVGEALRNGLPVSLYVRVTRVVSDKPEGALWPGWKVLVNGQEVTDLARLLSLDERVRLVPETADLAQEALATLPAARAGGLRVASLGLGGPADRGRGEPGAQTAGWIHQAEGLRVGHLAGGAIRQAGLNSPSQSPSWNPALCVVLGS
jgi:hypothetical protein